MFCKWLGLILCIVAFSGGAMCQPATSDDPPPQPIPDYTLYDTFFQQVFSTRSILVPIPTTASESDGPRRFSIPKQLQDVLGLDDKQVEALNQLSSEFMEQIAKIDRRIYPLVFESRLQAAESGKISDSTQHALADLEDQRHTVVLDYVKRLKSAIGDEGFRKVDAYVHAPEATRQGLFPTYVVKPPAKPVEQKQ